MGRPTMFWSHFERTPGCWLWTGRVDKDGYGRVEAQGEVRAPRLSWLLHRGPIPEGLVIDHLCRVRRCVNPDHMELVTNRENVLRGRGFTAMNARKTYCIRGHQFTPENTRINSEGRRVCRTCVQAWATANRLRRKQALGGG